MLKPAARREGLRLGVFSVAQGTIQAASLAAGLLSARHLEKSEYAAYSLSIGTLAAASLISGSGFGSIILSRGAQLRTDPGALSSLVASAYVARRKVSFLVGMLAVAILIPLLARIGVGYSAASLQAVILLFTLAVTVRTALIETVLALNLDRNRLQVAGLLAAVLRILLILALINLKLVWAVAFLLVNSIVAMAQRAFLLRVSRRWLEGDARPNKELQRESLRANRLLLPVNVTLAMQGQLVSLVLAGLGLAEALADVGALSRVTAAFAVAVIVTRWYLAPKVARSTKDALGRTYIRAAFLPILVVAVATTACSIAPKPLLALLGPKYGHLVSEFRLVLLAGLIAVAAEVLAALNEARGWIRWMWVQAPVSLLVSILTVIALKPSSTLNGAQLALVGATPGLIVQALQSVVGLRSLPASRRENHN